MNILDKFNSKRKHSTYLQYQNGDILEVEEKNDNIDNAPKLDIQDNDNKVSTVKEINSDTTESINIDEKKSIKKSKVNIFNILKNILICFILISLTVCVFQLSSIFLEESKEFVNINESIINEDKTLSMSTDNVSSNNNNNNNDTQINTTTNKTNMNNKYRPMLNSLTSTHNSIHNKLIEIKSNISSSSDVALVQNKLIRTSFSINTIKSELEENRELFVGASCDDLYMLLSNRIDNEITLINSLKKETSIESMIDILNNSIIIENNYVNEQTNLLQNLFDKNSIPYSINNNIISWTISDNT